MANEGKRKQCLCIQEMSLIIAKEKNVLFYKGQVYACVIRISDTKMSTYKIYGEEFALSCNEKEFVEYFQIIT